MNSHWYTIGVWMALKQNIAKPMPNSITAAFKQTLISAMLIGL